jgi:hypothetical protein
MELPDNQRFSLRCDLEAAGADCVGYEGGGFQLAIKRGKWCEVHARACQLGLQLVPNSLYHFPLGSDNPPEEFRHWCPPYTAERGFAPGFWLYATYRPVPVEKLTETKN